MFQWILFTSGLICNGGKPAYVPDELLRAMQQKVKQINQLANMAVNSVDEGASGKIVALSPKFESVINPDLKGSVRSKLLLKVLQY